ncbi:purine and uridine phosphorylase [Aureobasidium pullulans]|uniref:Purine and uridine phosphorylase n=1 Tax=Aureobasidium pullulans TaxID=5580 RepID=A0AB74JLK5_AURPU|nr:purine and uridine phosphorylase [Aureobasidium pullulans]THX45158.1 purine and uridine phosphorylase [Aureobasidium pullulans]
MSNPKDYTILWICALPLEYVAAQAFLDQEDPKPGVGQISNDDTNAYTLGQIAGHKVVLAVLPKGEIGVGSAASVIIHIIRSFPNIRIGLLVGVGGGAPTKDHDIRLGDIVVSSPKDGRSGIYHHDFGKETQETGFQQTGFLNQPPDVVLTAIAALKAKHTLKGHTINQSIEHAMIKNPRLRTRGFARPNPTSDRLHKSDVLHSAIGESCTGRCESDPHNLVLRRQRGDDDDDPAIYYGLIGSGNKLIRNALMRDKLAQDPGIFCFEMEAAGIMNRMPCLVIRGICDYCDSHKNKDWQGYAAMTAAAYAKELLLEIHPRSIEAENKLVLAVEGLSGNVSKVGSSVEQLKAFGSSNAITAWLDAPNPSVNFNRAHDAHHAGTGQWFFETDQFLQWRRDDNSFLWLHGTSGCGKTVLSSTIVRRLAEDDAALVLFFYFDFSDAGKQQFEAMIRSFLVQIYHKTASAQASIRLLYDSHSQGCLQPGLELIEDTLRSILSHLEHVNIVIDALDESQTLNRVLQWCKNTHDCKTTSLRLLVTSRTQVVPVQWPNRDQLIPMYSAQVNNDIRSYVRKRVHSDEFEHWKDRSTIQDRVETELTEKADGMFRWAALQLDALKECYNKSSVEQALRNLPKTLYDTYTRTLDIIQAGPHSREVTLILQMLVWSGEPLSADACNDAIVVTLEQVPSFDKDDRFFGTSYIVKICAGLITVNTSWGVNHLRLAHASVNDYLLSSRCSTAFADQLTERIARVSILRTCFAYLHCLDWSIAKTSHFFERDYPFARWAATCWLQIVKIINNMDDMTALVVNFLQSDSFPFESFFRYMFQCIPRVEEGQSFPLYLAAYMGLERSSRYLIQSELVFSVSGLQLPIPVTPFTPERDRIEHLQKQIRTMSIAGQRHDQPRPHSANLEDLQNRLDASLVVASIQGHCGVVRDLMYYGALPDAIDCLQISHLRHLNALQLAAEHGHWRIVKLLVDSGSAIDFYEEGQHDGTALYQASRAGHIEVVRTLIASGANVNINCGMLGNALMAAIDSASDHADLVQVLIDAGAEFSRTVQTRSPLQLASTRGNTRIVQVLINKGVHIDIIGYFGTALKLAAEYGRERIVELLLSHGADVELRQIHVYTDRSDWTPLHAAVSGKHIKIVELLLERGANLNGTKRLRPLVAAAMRNDQAVAKILLDNGADINATEDFEWSTLIVAIVNGYWDLAHWLLEQGADTHIEEPFDTPLTHAICKGNAAMVESLLDHKADTNAGGMPSALVTAVSLQKDEIIDLLLARGVDVDVALCVAWQSTWPRRKYKQKAVRRLRRLQQHPQSQFGELQDETWNCLLDGRALQQPQSQALRTPVPRWRWKYLAEPSGEPTSSTLFRFLADHQRSDAQDQVSDRADWLDLD